MIAKVKNFEIRCEPMTRYEYFDKIRKIKVQHLSNKGIKGFYCDGNGYKFWLNEDDFNKMYIIEE